MINQRLFSSFRHQYGICLDESQTPLLQKVLSGKEREETAAFTGY